MLLDDISERLKNIMTTMEEVDIVNILEDPIKWFMDFFIHNCGNCGYRKICWGKKYFEMLGINPKDFIFAIAQVVITCSNKTNKKLEWEGYKW